MIGGQPLLQSNQRRGPLPYLSTLSGRRSVSKFRVLRFTAPLGCGHVFDLLMRPIHGPLAMMPFPLILGPDQLHALGGAGSKMGFPGSSVPPLGSFASVSLLLLPTSCATSRLAYAAAGSR
jgi:hypothetical protein